MMNKDLKDKDGNTIIPNILVDSDGQPAGANTYNKPAIDEIIVDKYSTNETKTNKIWIDGKPIYRKVFVGKIEGNSCTIKIDVEDYNLVSYKSYVTDDTRLIADGNMWRGGDNNFSSYCYINNNEIIFATGGATRSGYNLVFILEYTKGK